MASAELENLFKACDTRGTGYLGQEELRDLCAKFGISTQDADAIFEDLDHDGDGKINFEDFSKGFTDFLTLSSTPPRKEIVLANPIQKQPFDSYSGSCLDDEKKQVVFQAWQNLTNELGKAGNLISEEKLLDLYKVLQSSERPHLVSYFETVIGDLLENVRNLQKENEQLESSWKREKKEHEKHLHRLEEELDSHMKDVELRVKKQAQDEIEAERRSLKLKMDAEMDELQEHLTLFEKVDSWLKSSQDTTKNGRLSEVLTKLEDAVQENRQLRISLMDAQTCVALMRSELAQVRSQYEEKYRELESEKRRNLEVLREYEHLNRQLRLLHDANKRLQDTNDALRELLDIGAKPSNKQITYGNFGKRGSVIGDYIQADKAPMEFVKPKQWPSRGTEEEYSLDIAKYQQMSLTSAGTNDDNYKLDSLGDDMDSGFSTIQDPFESASDYIEEDVDEDNESLERKVWSSTTKDSTSSIHTRKDSTSCIYTQSSSEKSASQNITTYFEPQIQSDLQNIPVFVKNTESDVLENKLQRKYYNTGVQSEGGTTFNEALNLKQLWNVDSKPESYSRPQVSSTPAPDTRVPTPRFSFEWSQVRPNKILSPGPQICSDITRDIGDREKPTEQPTIAGGKGQSQLKKLKEVREQIAGDSDSFEPTGPPDRTYKVVFIGDAAVGKTSMILRISKGMFFGNMTSTIGVDFQMKSLRVDSRNVAVQLWDTAGQERFRSITQSYFRKADGIMLVYDCTSEYSFLNVRQWMDAIDDVTSQRIPVMLVANKVDQREMVHGEKSHFVQTEDGEKLAKDFKALFAEVSAKTGYNVLKSLAVLARSMSEIEDLQMNNSGLSLKDLTSKKENSGKCQNGCSR
ncbi:ras and EF-hand domain-containing protein-like isoform X2 [Tachypleus tridentatus]|uniref:ras and EF-hand domain-containing protein-like isoform X2 n=1 Tax=Tachypleus tridentatus TaxID=6853 RepID=UPI003FD54F98